MGCLPPHDQHGIPLQWSDVMNAGYRIESTDNNQFVVFGPDGESVAVHGKQEDAEQEVKRCLKEDAMYDAAKLVVEDAIRKHMEMFSVDRQTACYWINSVTGAPV
jgi:predicted RNA binding protein with dsRBD fold (UPF0201 family)